MEENQDAVRAQRAVRLFSEELQKRLAPMYELDRDTRVETLCGSIPVPLCASHAGQSIAFDFVANLKGEDFRDGLLLGSGLVPCIYRMPASAVPARLDDILYAISLWEPRLFTDRDRYIVERKASPRMNDLVRKHGWPLPFAMHDSYHAWWDYPEDGESLVMERRTFRNDGRDYWSECFQFAQTFGGGSFEEVLDAWTRQSRLLGSS